ncbi:hypothetical protein [Burkholderia gladioli]|uniref:hypothetical protein n=1 Tax=Burkholderia gladioli TaxID=28095 RepID=UPI00163DF0A9|nr:hypothetical protein [Burkholderia gladioli]
MATSNPDVSVFEERAENLTQSELQDWTVLSQAEQQVLRKLTGPGAKLISGPRGSGKSTLLRTAFFQLVLDRTALPVYVNYSKALALEPLFHSHADAVMLFRQWVLAKILLGVRETNAQWQGIGDTTLWNLVDKASEYVQSLEAGSVPSKLGLALGPSQVAQILELSAHSAGVSRTVLLLDDAAHAFSVKQQREFFEVFRELRSRQVSVKAAIYPGVTSFSPSFQIGHEAEVIEAWFRPDREEYLPTMQQIAEKRFPDLAGKFGASSTEFVEALALASFGLPRGFVGMISDVQDSVESGATIRRAVLDAIQMHADLVMRVFTNVSDRLPRFAHYVTMGRLFERKSKDAIKDFNRDKATSRKSATVALAEPVEDEFDRVLRFMEYAGLIRRLEDLSKGVKGIYRRYLLHYACVIDGNYLALGKSFKVGDIVESLRSPNAHALVKTKVGSLVGNDYLKRCTLALPPCPRCSTARLAEDQKFCMNCGYELATASVYAELLKAPIEKLPIPSRKIQALRDAGFLTVGQLLSDETQKFRKPGSSIGPIWARRIITVAEEYVSV